MRRLTAEIPAEPGSTFLEPMEWRVRVAACGWAQWIYEGKPSGLSGAFVFLRDSRNVVNISPRTAAVLHPTEGRDERTLRASMNPGLPPDV